jgi:hypothetical protein
MLLLGYAQFMPVHLVTNVSDFEQDDSRPLAVVTVYKPESPRWLDERTRGRGRK